METGNVFFLIDEKHFVRHTQEKFVLFGAFVDTDPFASSAFCFPCQSFTEPASLFPKMWNRRNAVWEIKEAEDYSRSRIQYYAQSAGTLEPCIQNFL